MPMFRRFMMHRYGRRPVGAGYRRRGVAASFGTTLLAVSVAVILLLWYLGYLSL